LGERRHRPQPVIEWSKSRGELLSRPATVVVSARQPCLARLVECPLGYEAPHECLLPLDHDGPHYDHGKKCIPFGIDW